MLLIIKTTHILVLTFIYITFTSGAELDIIESLIQSYNSPNTDTSEAANEKQEVCNLDVQNLGDNVDNKFYSPHPDDPKYLTRGFRKLGEDCDLEKEREFWESMFEIGKRTAKDYPQFENSQINDLSYRFLLEEWSKKWITVATNPNKSLSICNPRWFLQCGKDQNSQREACVCLTKGLKHLYYPIEFEEEKLPRDGCHDTGECDDPNSKEIKANPGDQTAPYRCVAKTYEITKQDDEDNQDEDQEMLLGCELNFKVFGICEINCNYGSHCTTLETTELKNKNAKFQYRKVCCDDRKGCLYKKKKSNGCRTRMEEWNVMLSLIVVLMM